MKAKLLVDTTITLKAGEIVDIDEKQYQMLKALNRVEPVQKEEKKETRKKSK